MFISFYRPNRANKGFACSFNYSAKDDCLFGQILKQSGWDDAKKIGSFAASRKDPSKNTTIKIEWVEVGAILDCIERGREFKSFHDGDRQTKAIAFTPWMAQPMDGKPAAQKGYSFSVSVGDKEDSTTKNAFYIGFNFWEAREVREFLIYAMHKHFDALDKAFVKGGARAEDNAVELPEPEGVPVKVAAVVDPVVAAEGGDTDALAGF
jgi:hypothetical protein